MNRDKTTNKPDAMKDQKRQNHPDADKQAPRKQNKQDKFKN